MPVRASIEPLTWENAFFGVNSAIVRITSEAPLLTPDALAPWSRVQAKIAASNTGELDALQQLGFSLVEGEVDLALPVNNVSDSGAVVAQEHRYSRITSVSQRRICAKPFSCAMVCA